MANSSGNFSSPFTKSFTVFPRVNGLELSFSSSVAKGRTASGRSNAMFARERVLSNSSTSSSCLVFTFSFRL